MNGCVKFTSGTRLALYATAILVPFGPLLVAIASSWLHYAWHDSPETYWDAQAVNLHGWLAAALGATVWGLAMLLWMGG
jgi:hypothetical protein